MYCDQSLVRMISSTFACVAFLASANSCHAANDNAVSFDAPALIVAEAVNPAVVEAPLMGGDLMRLRIPVSTLISQRFGGVVDEYVVEFRSPQQSMRVVDFWPRDEAYTNVEGTIKVQQSEHEQKQFSFDVSAAYEPIGRGQAKGDYQAKSDTQESFQRRPPMQVLTSSGTIDRGFGVFFKFRPGPIPVLEGSREVAMLFEVPRGWRGDMLQVSMSAIGRSAASSNRSQTLGSTRLWISTHREGDVEAAAAARKAITEERRLRVLAVASQQKVSENSLPTIFHKVGESLNMIEPRIPSDYLSRCIFGDSKQYYAEHTKRLPVDLRVAMLDYWDERDHLLSLARPQYGAIEQRVVAKPILQDRYTGQ